MLRVDAVDADLVSLDRALDGAPHRLARSKQPACVEHRRGLGRLGATASLNRSRIRHVCRYGANH